MKILALLAVIAFVIFVFLMVAALKKWLEAEGQWEKREISDGEQVKVYAICPGQEELLVGSVAFANSDFELKIEELRNEATYKVNALNSGRKELT